MDNLEMARKQHQNKQDFICIYPDEVPDGITEEDEDVFFKVVSTELDVHQSKRIVTPPKSFPKQHDVLAVHWHPEFVPMNLIKQRVESTFPNLKKSLIIPTDHNILRTYDGNYLGVEVDCYSEEFKQKVQLLIHFAKDREVKADVFKSMLAYTFEYRSSQLFDFIKTIVEPIDGRISSAVRETGADENLVNFVRSYVEKINTLLEKHFDNIPKLSLKNKLLRRYFDMLRPKYGHGLINRAQSYLKAVKTVVKQEFPMDYFYRTHEIIEEARSIGAGIVIPHPEQFWPILLAEYSVDGCEVWNPQSRKYTEFLISTLLRKNRRIKSTERRLLIFMGDDTHMGEKIKPADEQVMSKAIREIGVQPTWDDLNISKKLILAEMQKAEVISEYKSRLDEN